jgi:hypothetical protein
VVEVKRWGRACGRSEKILLIFMCVPSSVFCVLFVCKCVLLLPGVKPIVVK